MGRTRREFLGYGVASAASLLAGCGREATGRAPSPESTPPVSAPALPPPIPADRYVRRRERVAQRMDEEGFDFLLVTPGTNLTYLTGASLGRSERLIALVVRSDATCRCLGPAFEAARLRASGLPGELHTWEESEDPIPLLAGMLATRGLSPRVAVEGTTWFDTLAPLSRRLPSARIASATPVVSSIRMRKEPEEIALMQFAVDLTLEAIRRVMEEARGGQAELDLLGRAQELVSAAGGSLDGLVQFGPNSAVPHAAPGNRKLRGSDVILLDFVTSIRGYHSDITRTFAFGKPPERFQEVYRVVKAAQEEGFRAARSGIAAGAADGAARSIIRKNGFGRHFTHRLGHGIGLDGHEPPYLVQGNTLVLEEGMTVTVEPGIYLPGEFGVRLEDDLLVTAAFPRVLSASTASASEHPGAGPDSG